MLVATLQASHALIEEMATTSKQLANVFRTNNSSKDLMSLFTDDVRRRVLNTTKQHIQSKRQLAETLSAANESATRQQATAPERVPTGTGAAMAPPDARKATPRLSTASTGGVASDAKKAAPSSQPKKERIPGSMDANLGYSSEALQARPKESDVDGATGHGLAQLEDELHGEQTLHRSQGDERDRVLKEHAAARAEAKKRWKAELSELTAAMAREICEFEENIVRAAALENVELPPQLQKLRFKPSTRLNKLNELRRSLDPTRNGGTVGALNSTRREAHDEEMSELDDQASKLEKQEVRIHPRPQLRALLLSCYPRTLALPRPACNAYCRCLLRAACACIIARSLRHLICFEHVALRATAVSRLPTGRTVARPLPDGCSRPDAFVVPLSAPRHAEASA